MKTHVVYKYRAPGSDPDQDVEIKTEAMSYEPEMVLKLIQAEGQALSLWYDYPEKYGAQKNYKVVECYIEPGTKNRLHIIVTGPDSEQILNGVRSPPLSRTPASSEPRESNLSASGEWYDINNLPERDNNATEDPWWEPPGSPETASEDVGKGNTPEDQDEPQRRSWWQRWFGIQ
jgi:hypothetical protein